MITGIDKNKACMLLALDEMFPEGYEGREFLIDLFIDHYKESGFDIQKDTYLIEESAPVIALGKGKHIYTVRYDQADYMVYIYDRNDNIRYRLYGNQKMILVYEEDAEKSHAICILASQYLIWLQQKKHCITLLPKNGLIVDHRTYHQDFTSGPNN